MKKSIVKSDKRRMTGYLLGVFALLVCPCHIPVYITLLSGTATGALLAENSFISISLFSALFLLFVFSTAYLLKKRKDAV